MNLLALLGLGLRDLAKPETFQRAVYKYFHSPNFKSETEIKFSTVDFSSMDRRSQGFVRRLLCLLFKENLHVQR
jgi:hypothetical protein